MKNTAAILSSFILNIVCVSAFGQTLLDSEELRELANYREQVEDLEVRFGRHDLQLLEPLTRLAEVAISLNQFDETNLILDRAVQIHRLNEGLYTEGQLPLLQMKAANSSRLGDWDKFNDTLDHLLWLYTNKHGGFDSDLIYELKQLSDMHFEAIVGDELAMQSHHFRKAADIGWIAIRVGETLWEPNDERLAELYYDLANQFYLQSIAMNNGGRTGYELREIVPESGWVQPRKTVRNRLYRSGVRLLSRLHDVFEAADPANPEAVAMADLYMADWELIFGRKSAEFSYTKAFVGLLESGVAIETLDRFFDQPMLLPIPGFYPSVEQALLASQQEGPIANLSSAEIAANSFQFNEWSTAFPNVQYPLNGAPMLLDESNSWSIATFSFDLAALEKISRWINGRYITNISVPQEFQILGLVPESAVDIGKLTDRIHSLHFRPKLRQGVPQPSNGTMRYQFYAD